MGLLSFSRTISTVLINISLLSKFCTETLKNARRKLLNLRNKHSVFAPNKAIFILERNLIGADFDHVLGNHFWAVSVRHAINKTTL